MNHNLKILTLLLFVGQMALAQTSIQFTEGDLKAAFARAKAEQKPVCLFCYASWCPHCANMKETVFNKSDVAIYYNQRFICVKQDMEKGEGVEMHTLFEIKSYPTFIFMDSNQHVLYRTAGELTAQSFIQEAKNALTPEKQLPYLKKQFEQNVGNATNCYVYLRALKKGEIDYSGVVKSYFATQTDKQLLSEINWRIIANGVDDLNSREFQFVLHHPKEYASIASPERVQRKILYLATTMLEPVVQINDTANYRIRRQQLLNIQNYQVDSLIFSKDITLNKYNEKWGEYQKVTLQWTEKFAWNNSDLLAEIADIYQKNITDSSALAQSLKWIKRSLALDAGYHTYLIGAKIYRKLNDLPHAILMANQAEKDALKYNWNHTEADELLEELQRK